MCECYSMGDETFGPVNIWRHTESDGDGGEGSLFLWNECCISVRSPKAPASTHTFHYTTFAIKHVLFKSNILLCLDGDHLLHFTILKKKNESKILETLEFKQILKNVLYLFNTESDVYVVLKKDTFICIYNYIFITSSKIKVANIYKLNDEALMKDILTSNCTMDVKKVKYFSVDFIRKVFKIEISKINLESLVLFIAKANVLYWSVLDEDPNTMNSINILYSTPVNIKSFHIVKDIDVIIYLNLETGSIVKLFYDVVDGNLFADIIHLNSSLRQIIYSNSTSLLYSDTVNVYSGFLKQKVDGWYFILSNTLPVSYPHAFYYDSDAACVYATTIHNILYKIELPKVEDINIASSDSITIPKNLSSISDIMFSIQKEIDENNDLLMLTDRENDYISVMFLNSKQNIVRNFLNSHFTACTIVQSVDYIEDFIKCHVENNDTSINIVELKIEKNLQQKLDLLLTNVNNLFFVNIQQIPKNSYTVYNTNILINKASNTRLGIPCNEGMNIPICVKIQVITLMPGVFQETHKFWSIIDANSLQVDSKYFFTMKTQIDNKKSIEFVQREKILSIMEKNSQFLFDVHEHTVSDGPYCLCIRLPDVFEKLSEEFIKSFVKHLSPQNADCVINQLKNYNFTHGLKPLTLNVYDKSVEIRINKNQSNQDKFKIISISKDVCFEVYKFVLEIVKDIYNSKLHRGRTIAHFDYVIFKNLKEDMEKIMDTTQISQKEALLTFLDAFYQDGLGNLPV